MKTYASDAASVIQERRDRVERAERILAGLSGIAAEKGDASGCQVRPLKSTAALLIFSEPGDGPSAVVDREKFEAMLVETTKWLLAEDFNDADQDKLYRWAIKSLLDLLNDKVGVLWRSCHPQPATETELEMIEERGDGAIAELRKIFGRHCFPLATVELAEELCEMLKTLGSNNRIGRHAIADAAAALAKARELHDRLIGELPF